MAQTGLDSIATAQENGTWSLMDDVENLIVPEDLTIALSVHESSMAFFQGQSKSSKKILLYWVATAKRSETRKKRIAEIVRSAAEGIKHNQFR